MSCELDAAEKGYQWELASGLLQEMLRSQLQSDVISYSAVISACEKAINYIRP